VLLALTLTALSGCAQNQPHQDDPNDMFPKSLPAIDINTGPQVKGAEGLLSYNPPSPDLKVAIGGAPASEEVESPSDDHTDRHYIEIADIYWKLNWMRRELLRGTVPYNMLEELDKATRRLKHLPHDVNYPLVEEALGRMHKGLEHLACQRILRAAQIDDTRVPWEIGVEDVKEYLDKSVTTTTPTVTQPLPLEHHPTGEEGEDAPTFGKVQMATPAPAQAPSVAVRLALDYETRYHTSPRNMMLREWETAIRQTNRLRDGLGLAHRETNNDGDATDVSGAVSNAAAGDFDFAQLPLDAGQSGVAPDPFVPHF
jgi:hypothetical protein